MPSSSVVAINAGGRLFQTTLATLNRFPDSKLSRMVSKGTSPACFRSIGVTTPQDGLPSIQPAEPTPSSSPCFIDVCPRVFERILNFLRTGQMRLPTHDLSLRADVVHQLTAWDLLHHAFPASHHDNSHNGGEKEDDPSSLPPPLIVLPDVCVVLLADTLSLDGGVRRHALTITYGSEGFDLHTLTRRVRNQLRPLLSSTYWQIHQTSERAAFFATTKVTDAVGALLTTTINQQVLEHTEAMGYHLASSYTTLSPDPVHTSVRLLLHHFIFRRVRLSTLEPADVGDLDAAGEQEEEEEVVETFRNFEPRHVGPQRLTTPVVPPNTEKSADFFPTSR